MTVALAWVATRRDGREDLYFASDSRTRGAMVLDACPKLLQLPRSDSAICFAGDTAATYPLMMQLANAIAAHGPARDRSLDISTLKAHMLRVFTDIILSVKNASVPFTTGDGQFIFGGYSWKSRAFRLWTIYWAPKKTRFEARESQSFHPSLSKVAFIGDRAKDLRTRVLQDLKVFEEPRKVFLEPLRTLAQLLETATMEDSIGGPPQVIRVTPHMNTRPLCVLWGSERVPTLFGRQLFDYENCDYWMIDPYTGAGTEPRSFGRRPSPGVDRLDTESNE